MRIVNHPILGEETRKKVVEVIFDGEPISAFEGEMVASALMASGKKVFRYTSKSKEPRGVFCAIGHCTDCMMEVNSIPNVRTCITPVKDKMIIKTQKGLGQWKNGVKI